MIHLLVITNTDNDTMTYIDDNLKPYTTKADYSSIIDLLSYYLETGRVNTDPEVKDTITALILNGYNLTPITKNKLK